MPRLDYKMYSKDGAESRKAALVILDMMNQFDFPGGVKMVAPAKKAAQRILNLKKKLKRRAIPVIYVNDHFGQWRADWKRIYGHCAKEESLGKDIAKLLAPEEDDYFILKPNTPGST